MPEPTTRPKKKRKKKRKHGSEFDESDEETKYSVKAHSSAEHAMPTRCSSRIAQKDKAKVNYKEDLDDGDDDDSEYEDEGA